MLEAMNAPLASSSSVPGWWSLLRSHARDHGFSALGLGAGLLAVLALLAQSLAQEIGRASWRERV